ncbi:Flap endonuclease 1 [Lucilia cuprina]|nr:Flap endonuclease 1 [Lucilia cuprina]
MNSYRDIETILENIDRKKYTVPENWNYDVARQLFITPEVQDPSELEAKPDEDGLVKFLCGDRQFNEDRVRSGARKILKSKQSQTQGRLDSFFKVLPSTGTTPKRKADDDKKNTSLKKAKAGGGSGNRGRRPK